MTDQSGLITMNHHIHSENLPVLCPLQIPPRVLFGEQGEKRRRKKDCRHSVDWKIDRKRKEILMFFQYILGVKASLTN